MDDVADDECTLVLPLLLFPLLLEEVPLLPLLEELLLLLLELVELPWLSFEELPPLGSS